MDNKDLVISFLGFFISMIIIIKILSKSNNIKGIFKENILLRNCFMKFSKKKINNIELMNSISSTKNLKLIDSFKSLAPTDKADNYDFYDSLISKVLLEKNNKDNNFKNKNIGITGLYSGGKSSIINTYLSNHRERKAITISLGKYNEDSCNKLLEDEIEYDLLQQIIYQVDPQDLPFSEINRIDSNYKYVKKRAISISILFVIFVASSIFLLKHQMINDIINSFNSPTKGMMFFLFSIIIILTIYIFQSIYIKIYSKLRNFRIKINGTLELEAEDASFFRKSVGEIIHFFKQTDFDIVIFEDMDRLENPISLFTKLKELNMLLNNAIKSRQIQFMYELGDSVFYSSENRTKFFDAIIPIVSYTNTQESSVSLRHLFEENLSNELTVSDYEFIGSYVNNTRVLNDIYNEFIVYYSCNSGYIGTGRNFTNLFYLISYKVLFPKNFEQLLQGKGPVSYYLNPDFSKDAVAHFKIKKQKELEDKIMNTLENEKLNFDQMVKKVIENIELLNTSNQNNIYFLDGESRILKLSELRSNFKLIDRLNIENLKISGFDEDGYEIISIDPEKIFGDFSKVSFFDVIKEIENQTNVEKLRKESENLSTTFKYSSIQKKDVIKFINYWVEMQKKRFRC